jgi:ribose transport system substrate-binding protein
VVGALLATACSSSPASSAAGGTTSAASSGSDAKILAAAQAANVRMIAGTNRTPPTGAPKPPKHQSVWVISCLQAAAGCAQPAAAIQQADKALGWQTTVVDGKFDPSTWAAAIQQAIAARANVIITVGFDCSTVKQPLQEAKAAHIVTVGVYGLDCNDLHVGGQAEYSSLLNLGEPTADYFRQWGRAQADYIIASSSGTAKVVTVSHTDTLITAYLAEGFDQEMAKCGTCQVVDDVKMVGADLVDGAIVQKVQTALVQHPETTWVHLPYDNLVLVLAKTIEATHPGIKLTGGEGFPANADLIRQGVETAGVAISTGWEGYAAVDTAIRLLDGQKSVPDSGIGLQVMDKTHNLPASGGYVPDIGYVADYLKSWGLG